MVDPGQQTGHGGLAGARVAHEDQMEGHGGHGQALFFPEPAHLHQVNEALHVPLYLLQTAQAVQLGQKILQLFRRQSLLLFRDRLRRRLGGGGGAAPTAGDEVPGIGVGPVPGQAVLVAQGGEGVGAGVDKTGLPVAHRPVHGGKEEEHQSHQVHEPPGGGLAVGPVIVHHFAEEGGGLEAGVLGHGSAQLPEEGGGDGIALAVDGIVPLHVLGSDGAAVGLPDSQGTLAEELVGAGVEHLPHGRVGDVLPEGGHPVAVLLVHGLGRHRVLHDATSFLSRRGKSILYYYMACPGTGSSPIGRHKIVNNPLFLPT